MAKSKHPKKETDYGSKKEINSKQSRELHKTNNEKKPV